MPHRLSDHDLTARTAWCSECSSRVHLISQGRGFRCGNAHAAAKARDRHRGTAKSPQPSPHKLSAVAIDPASPSVMVGLCPICGPVEASPVGRGWGCKVRVGQLNNGRREPAVRCDHCGHFPSRANPLSPMGSCRRCSSAMSLTNQIRPVSRLAPWEDREGMHLVGPTELLHVERMADVESVVPGWRTIA